MHSQTNVVSVMHSYKKVGFVMQSQTKDVSVMPAFKSCFRLALVEKVDSVMRSYKKKLFPSCTLIQTLFPSCILTKKLLPSCTLIQMLLPSCSLLKLVSVMHSYTNVVSVKQSQKNCFRHALFEIVKVSFSFSPVTCKNVLYNVRKDPCLNFLLLHLQL